MDAVGPPLENLGMWLAGDYGLAEVHRVDDSEGVKPVMLRVIVLQSVTIQRPCEKPSTT